MHSPAFTNNMPTFYIIEYFCSWVFLFCVYFPLSGSTCIFGSLCVNTLFSYVGDVCQAQCLIVLLRVTYLHSLTLRLLMSYIYGAHSKTRNANVVYIWTYVWQRWNSLFLFAAQCFNTESMQRGFLCHICV